MERMDETQLTQSLRDTYSDRKEDILFEARLYRSGLLQELEQSGILPTVEKINQYDPITETAQHEAWWRKNPDRQSEYIDRVDLRNRVLRWLRIGSSLNFDDR